MSKIKAYRCYVCQKFVKPDNGVYIGKGVWRHKKCAPLSKNWLNSEVSKNSEFREIMEVLNARNNSQDRQEDL